MFKGYFRLGGVEVVNSERTYQYVTKNMPGFPLVDCDDCSDDLHLALGDKEYESPLVDDAPWVDDQNPATHDFYGFYPLELSGSLDDTRVVTVTEGILDGGSAGQTRYASRSMRYRGLLIARDRLALHAGMTWLKAALSPSPCSDHGGSCGGATSCLYAACPEITECYSDTITSTSTDNPIGSVSADTPFSIAFRGDALAHPSFRIPETDGVVFRWGTRALESPMIREEHGPVISRRTNSVPNPSFTVDTSGWLGGGAFISRVATGGVDGGPYMHFDTSSTGSTRTPNLDGFFGEVTGQFALRGTGNVTATIVTVEGNVVLTSIPITLTTAWSRYYIHANYGRGVYLAFEGSSDFDIDQVMLEAGHLELPYFDGSTVMVADPLVGVLAPLSATSPTYSYAWSGLPNASPSVMRWTGFDATGIPAGQQFLDLDEVCDTTQFRIFLEVDAGTLPSGYWDATYRAAIPAEDQAVVYERNFHDVTCTTGPKIINEFDFDTGSAIEVDFILTAGTPFAYGTTDDIITRLPFSGLPTQPWADVACAVDTVNDLVDPDCPPIPSAPRPPAVPALCIDDVTRWQRYALDIPGERVSGWSQMLPTIVLTTPPAEDIRQVRVRFTPNPFGYDSSTQLRRNNQVTNPALWVNSTGWNTVIGTFSRIAGAPNGGSVARVTATAAHASQGFGPKSDGTGLNLVTPGKIVNLAIWGRASTSRALAMQYTFWNAAGTIVGTTAFASAVTPAANTWTRLYVTGITVPATAVRVSLGVVNNSVGVSGETIDATMAMVEQTTTPIALLPYMDGNTAVDHGVWSSWDGVVGNSTSSGYYSALDPCAYCSEFILSYLPANAELTVDGLTRSAYASVAGGAAQPASQLLYGTDGVPMTWPSLSCGIDYVMTVDVPAPTGDVLVSLSLTRQE